MMAKCFVSSQSEHGWRAPLNGLNRNGWNVLGRTFQYTTQRIRMHTIFCTGINYKIYNLHGAFVYLKYSNGRLPELRALF
jgi:hypothetical protein